MPKKSIKTGSEKWLPCPHGAKNRYMISDKGRLWDKEKEKLIRPTKIGQVRIVTFTGKRKLFQLKRLVMRAFRPGDNARYISNLDGNPLNCSLDNLAYRKTLATVVTEEQAIEVVKLYESKQYHLKEISEMTGVAMHNVAAITSGRSFGHLKMRIRSPYSDAIVKRKHRKRKRINKKAKKVYYHVPISKRLDR